MEVPKRLYNSILQNKLEYDGDALRICQAVVSGKADAVVRVDNVCGVKKRSIVAAWRIKIPPKATVWFSDATASLEEIELLVDQKISCHSISGELPRLHSCKQVLADVTKNSSPKKAA